MSTPPLDQDDEVEQLIRQLVTYALKNRRGRVPVAFGFRVIYAPADAALDSSSSEESIETVPEVMTIDDTVIVVAELPGVTADSIRLALSGQTLRIVADHEHWHYRSEASLPHHHLVPWRTSFKHGVLEVMLRQSPDDDRTVEISTD